jgi:hypothetical protein
VVSVRQRRDYRVPSVLALLRAAEESRAPGADEPITTVGSAIIELMQSGDGSMGMLDLPELEPLDGVVVVAEVTTPLQGQLGDQTDAEHPFRLGTQDRTVARLDERTLPDLDSAN